MMYADKYSPREGADWISTPNSCRITKSMIDNWDVKKWGMFGYLSVEGPTPINMHAIHFPDNSVWDCVNGWRDTIFGSPDTPYNWKLLEEVDPNGKSNHEPGAKLDAGKSQPGYFFVHYFPRAMCAVADVGAAGAAKYTYRGWMHVPNGLTRYTDALMRHEVEIGKHGFHSRDEQLNVLHAAQVAWNALARLELLLGGESKKDLLP